MNSHEPFMQRALELARRGEGLTRPNPPVGAVLVRNGKIIAEGFHKTAGSAHAEVNCLKKISGDLKHTMLYVTLEPCSTCGKTPPCTDLILQRKIPRVVIGAKDPNPVHAGRGITILRRAGIEVSTGICRTAAEELVAPFAKRILTGLPFVTLKLGVTLDGQIADSSGKSKWITGAPARRRVQELRRRVDAILVGAGTVRADNPSLLPRPAKGRKPWRIIAGGAIPADSAVLTDEAAERTIVTRAPPEDILRDLGGRGIMHVLCEGGGELSGALIRAGLVDELLIFMAPAILGGAGIPMFGKRGWMLDDMPQLVFNDVERLGEDILIKAAMSKV
ncbi:MAG: bifunctional diaminohydroxyphosphoribosylaminopyrimidine deaminase/5-amino-6-(5-phosphoribosylamino)uracil reductase RibD [Kiritimatiellales bacterium]